MWRGRDGVVGPPLGHLLGGGQEVVHQRNTEQTALRIEGHLLAHGHSIARGEAALHLALDDHRVDTGAVGVLRRNEHLHPLYVAGSMRRSRNSVVDGKTASRSPKIASDQLLIRESTRS
jgi:hypothetical protein